MHKPFPFRLVLLILLLVSCSPATPTLPAPLIEPPPVVQDLEKIEAVTCPFETPEAPAITCGKLAVPEDYRNPKDKKIHLLVVTIHSTATSPAKDPVIVLYSDPGTVNLRFVQYSAYDPLFAEILKERDLVFYDMR